MSCVERAGSETAKSLAKVCRRIEEISTLPHIALRVLEVASNPDTGAREVKQIMEADAALSARVLRCVNSSAYAVRNKVTNLQQAVAFLGIKQIRNLAMTAGVSSLFQDDVRIGLYDRKLLWRHLVSVGICARMIAMRLHLLYFEDVFLAGLLHDVGIILEDQYAHRAFSHIIDALQPGKMLPAIECRHLGFDHCTLGEWMARQWKLPGGVIDAIRWHHDAATYRGQYLDTVQCVQLANYLCSAKGFSAVGLHLVEFPRGVILAMGLQKEDLLVLAEDLDRELDSNSALFHL
jgi:HD-like signal output (HDOD) protein